MLSMLSTTVFILWFLYLSKEDHLFISIKPKLRSATEKFSLGENLKRYSGFFLQKRVPKALN